MNWMLRGALLIFLGALPLAHGAEVPPELALGRAGHAFDHLGNIGEQAAAAAASGAHILYTTGLGALGYGGLPAAAELAGEQKRVMAYNDAARSHGIQTLMGYVCATSIVKLGTFNAHWSESFRAQFSTPPADWRQVGRDGRPLSSWYGGDYQPACMNHPDWRRYEKAVVRLQLQSGHDGIFFDNPTVHPQGCYCHHCLEKFIVWLRAHGVEVPDLAIEATRSLPEDHPAEFLRFRCETARDFLGEMRTFARSVKPGAYVTGNNSLNSPDALYSQARTYGYHIGEMSKAEDYVVVEDMKSQPRQLSDGTFLEYGSTYHVLQGIARGKPVVAVTIAEADYHTPIHLVRLAMAEAVASGSSYLSWPTWPEAERTRMAAGIRPQASFFRRHESLLNRSAPRVDVLLFLPYRRFLETEKCRASDLAAALTRANVQYRVITEESMATELARYLANAGAAMAEMQDEKKRRLAAVLALPVLLVESVSVLTPGERSMIANYTSNGGEVVGADEGNWPVNLAAAHPPSLQLKAPSAVRVALQDHPEGVIAHLYNLGIERISSTEDRVNPAREVALKIRISSRKVHGVTVLTADSGATVGSLKYTVEKGKNANWVITTLPKLDVSALVVVEF